PIARCTPLRFSFRGFWASPRGAVRAIRHASLPDGRLRWTVQSLQGLAFPQVHVHTAGQAWIETAHRAHDVDALEVFPSVLLEDRLTLYRILVGARCTKAVARAGVPRRGWVGVIVGDLAVPDHHVVAQHAADRLGEAAADGLVGHLELLPGLGAPGPDFLQR